MKHRLSFSFILLIIFSLLGCANQMEPIDSSTDNVVKEPPDLSISVGGKTLNPIRGTYSWSNSNGDGTTTGVNADSPTPPNLVKNNQTKNVNPEANVELNFEKSPQTYSARVWNADNSIKSSYDKIILSNQQGKVIYEIIAEWEM